MDKKAFIQYVASLLLFGLNGIVASRIALNSYEIVFFRTAIGSAFLLILFLIGKGKFHIKEYKKDALFIALSGIAMGASWMFLYEAFRQIGVSLSTLLYCCGPVIVMMLSPIIFKEKLTLFKILGFVVVFIGIFLVNGTTVGKISLFGLFCAGMSAVLYFFMVTFNKQAKNIGGLENSVIQLVVSFITVSIFLLIKQGFVLTIPSNAWVWILLLGIVHTGVGCYLYFSQLSKLSAQTVAVCSYIEPLSAVIFATIFLNETMSALQIIGAVCIIGGAMLGELVKIKKR